MCVTCCLATQLPDAMYSISTHTHTHTHAHTHTHIHTCNPDITSQERMGEGSGGGFITRCMLEPVLRILRYRLLLTGKCTHYYANVCVCGKSCHRMCTLSTTTQVWVGGRVGVGECTLFYQRYNFISIVNLILKLFCTRPDSLPEFT